jgi:LuxR family transcriptional regulator, maltose regulon positive regulatory protein
MGTILQFMKPLRDRMENGEFGTLRVVRAQTLPQRLTPPPADSDLPRNGLADGLHEAAHRSVILLEAPAGYGKTAVLIQWRRAALINQQLVAWATMQTAQRTAAGLLQALFEAFDALGIEGLPEPPEEAGLQVSVALERYVESLMAVLASHRQRLALVLDDYHVAATASSDAVIALLVSMMPDNLTIAIASRHLCKAPLTRVLLEGRLRRIDHSALRFSKTELRAFMGSGLSPEVLHNLQATTEGWPAALRIAQLCLPAWRKIHDDPRHAPEFTRMVAEYCRSELLRSVSNDELQLLIDTSIVTTFDARLCDAIGEREDSTSLLARLIARETFVEPFDSKPRTFRIHFLLNQYLQQLGEERGRREASVRHTRAAKYLETHADTLGAMHHYLAAGNATAAATCLERAHPLHLAVNRGDEFATAHLQLIATDDLMKFPRLALCQAYLQYKQGLTEPARHLMESLAAHTHHFKTDRPGGDDRQFVLEVAYVESIQEMFQTSAISAERLDLFEKKAEMLYDDPVLAAVFARSLGMLHALRGDLDTAERSFVMGARLLVREHAPWGTFWLKYHLGALALARGKLMDVRYHVQAGMKLWRSSFKTYVPYGALSRLLLAELDYEADVLTEAQIKLDESLFVIETAGGWFDSFAGAYELGVLLRAHANRWDEVEGLLARASTQQRIGSLLQGFLQALRLRCLILCGRFDAAGELARTARWHERWASPRAADEFSYRERHLIGLCLARMAIESGDSDDATQILDRLEHDALRGGQLRTIVKIGLYRAAILDRNGAAAAALGQLKEALERGHAQGYRRTFLDESSLLRPLLARACDQTGSALPEYLLGYAQSLLRALSPQPLQDSSWAPLLSTRELEVLQELHLGYANKVIARKLDLSEATVKFHVKNIFRKLKVRKRAAAVAEAHRHGIIN